MSDIAALILASPASKANSSALSSSSIQPASSGVDAAGSGSALPQTGEIPSFPQSFQGMLDQQRNAPPAVVAPAPVAAAQSGVQAGDPAIASLLLANAIAAASIATPGNVTGNILPVPANSGNGFANGDEADAHSASDNEPNQPSATTLALAGAMAVASQIIAPGTTNAQGAPAPAAASASPVALRASPVALRASPLTTNGTGGDTAKPELAKDTAGKTPTALLAVSADPNSPAAASAIAASITLIAPDQPAQERAGPTQSGALQAEAGQIIAPQSPETVASGKPTTRLRPVLTSADKAANAELARPALTIAGDVSTSPFAKTPTSDDGSAQDLPTTPILSLSSANAAQPASPFGMMGGVATTTDPAMAGNQPVANAGQSQDFAALVDRLVEARAAARSNASPQVVEASISHAQFGQVGLRFEQGADGLSVSMSSADPEFNRAAQVAIAAQPPIAAPGASTGAGLGNSGDQPGGRSGQPTLQMSALQGGSGGGFGQSSFSQSGQQSQNQHPQRDAGFANPGNQRPAASAGQPRRQSGILA